MNNFKREYISTWKHNELFAFRRFFKWFRLFRFQMVSRVTFSPRCGRLRKSGYSSTLRFQYITLHTHRTMQSNRNWFPITRHCVHNQHAHDCTQRFSRLPGGWKRRRFGFRPATHGFAAMRFFRHVYDLVRQHYDQSRSDVPQRWTGRSLGNNSTRPQLPPHARTIPTLHFKRFMDRHKRHLRRSHIISSAQTTPRLDQSQCRGGQGGRPSHHFSERHRSQWSEQSYQQQFENIATSKPQLDGNFAN